MQGFCRRTKTLALGLIKNKSESITIGRTNTTGGQGVGWLFGIGQNKINNLLSLQTSKKIPLNFFQFRNISDPARSGPLKLKQKLTDDSKSTKNRKKELAKKLLNNEIDKKGAAVFDAFDKIKPSSKDSQSFNSELSDNPQASYDDAQLSAGDDAAVDARGSLPTKSETKLLALKLIAKEKALARLKEIKASRATAHAEKSRLKSAKQLVIEKKQSSLMRRDENIKTPNGNILLISPDGAKAEYSLAQAIAKSRESGLTVYQVSADGQIPVVCKAIHWGTFRKEERQKEKKRKETEARDVKLLRIRSRIDPHDLQIKVDQTINFLEKNHPVKFSVDDRDTDTVIRLLKKVSNEYNLEDYSTNSGIHSDKNFVLFSPLSAKQREAKQKKREKQAAEATKKANPNASPSFSSSNTQASDSASA